MKVANSFKLQAASLGLKLVAVGLQLDKKFRILR
jgi:hypothetical protein